MFFSSNPLPELVSVHLCQRRAFASLLRPTEPSTSKKGMRRHFHQLQSGQLVSFGTKKAAFAFSPLRNSWRACCSFCWRWSALVRQNGRRHVLFGPTIHSLRSKHLNAGVCRDFGGVPLNLHTHEDEGWKCVFFFWGGVLGCSLPTSGK